ncbi:MAG: nickel pincer cofactor biosynthesis protein LarC [Treponema sp.]|nr:nickel pincer cofactor biosynthesis protein LarC [Treponema sp.]
MEDNSLYLECTSGISGDMAVAALLDAGADQDVLEAALKSIPAQGFRTEISRVSKAGISCCDFNVILDDEHENHDHDMEYLFGHEHSHDHEEHEHHHHEHDENHLEHEHHQHDEHHDENEHHHENEHTHSHHHTGIREIYSIIDATTMTDGARTLAKKIFDILAQAESKAHNVPVEEVHFHEVGAIDSIVDIIALAVCFDNLNPAHVYVPHLCEGTGTVRCQHGILPVPVPAVTHIISAYNIPLEIMSEHGEFVTPTGAAFVAAVRTDAQLPRHFTVNRIGMGAGKRNYRRPSILRAMMIQENEVQGDDANTVYKLESNIDDSNGEQLGFVMELLLKAGAFDVHYVPCFMKKNRPGWLLNVICSKDIVPELEQIIFKNTTTIGIRRMKYERSILPRKTYTVQTAWGEADVKEVTLPDGEKRIYPEYESMSKICKETGLSYSTVYAGIVEAASN